jgi:tetratricopeptide (TPR) repeat protein
MLEAYFGEEASGAPVTRWRPFWIRGYRNNNALNLREEFEDCLLAEGDFSRAFTFQSGVYRAIREAFGDEHTRTVDAAERLAIALSKLHRQQEAIDLERSVLSKRRNTLGAEHKYTISAMEWLVGMHKQHGDLDEAEDLLRSLVDIAEQQSRKNTSALVNRLCMLVDILDDQGELEKARDVANRALRISNSEKDRMDASQWLGRILNRLRDFEAAVSILRDVVAYRTRTLGTANTATISSMTQLSNSLYLRGNIGDLDEARLLAIQAHDSAVSQWGEEDEQGALAQELLEAIQIKEGE